MFTDDSSSSWSDYEAQESTRDQTTRPSNRTLFSIDRDHLRQANPDYVCPILVTPEPNYDELAKYLLDLYVDANPSSFEETSVPFQLPEITAPPIHSDVPVDWTCFFPSDDSYSEETLAWITTPSSYVPTIDLEAHPTVLNKNSEKSEEEFNYKEEGDKSRFRDYALFPSPSALWLKERLIRTHHLLPETIEASAPADLNNSALDDAFMRALYTDSKREGDERNKTTPSKRAKQESEAEENRLLLHNVIDYLREEIRKKSSKFPVFPTNIMDNSVKQTKGSKESGDRTGNDVLRDLTNKQQANLIREHLSPLRMKPFRQTLHNPSGARYVVALITVFYNEMTPTELRSLVQLKGFKCVSQDAQQVDKKN